MAVKSRTFWLPRRGSSTDEYEDARALDDASRRYALADGATEGCFTGLWARLLVEDFVSHPELAASKWSSSLSAIQRRWNDDVRARKLDWDADYWIEQGAFAAFLGIALAQDGCCWQAVAVGDTCLFHTRDNALLRAFPLDRSDKFGNRPQLVGSRMPVAAIDKRQRIWSDGCGRSGDRLWAMTDALAKWCLAEYEASRAPWRQLESLVSSPKEGDVFSSWIESLRDAGGLLNDDVTLLAIRL